MDTLENTAARGATTHDRPFAVVTGASTGIKLQAAISHITPHGTLAEMHRGMAEPGAAQ
jgi:hypothetical protein